MKQLGYLKYEKEEFTDKVPDLNVDDEFDIDFKVVEKLLQSLQEFQKVIYHNIKKSVKEAK